MEGFGRYMNLLMITRKIDKDDWLAGHSYEWAAKLSAKCKVQSAKLYVICLSKGNVDGLEAEVYSLGKELGNSRWNRFWKFQRLAKKLVPKVDGIFIHQNPEYAIVVWPWAFFYGKKIVSWYTHKSVTWKSRLMLVMSKKVLTASKKSFRIQSPKVQIIGHGIDTEKFKRQNSKGKIASENSKFKIISVGRISPTKDLETMILAVKDLSEAKKNIELAIYGDTGLEIDKSYLASLKELVKKSSLSDKVRFMPPVPYTEVAEIYKSADLFINLSLTGSLDKAVLEAMACEVPIITSNEGFNEMLKPFRDLTLTKSNNPAMLADKILRIKILNQSDKNALGANLRSMVVSSHSLDNLAEKILASFA